MDFTYNYSQNQISGDWLLTSINKPAVQFERPTVSFAYEVWKDTWSKRWLDGSAPPFTGDARTLTTWTLPSSITDARQIRTSFSYINRAMPVYISSDGTRPQFWWEYRPQVQTVTTPDGVARFSELQRTHLSAKTQVQSPAGGITTFQFGTDTWQNQTFPADNNLGYSVIIDQITRCTTVTSADGTKQTKTVTYEFSHDPFGNLLKVVDMSGNTLLFSYRSQGGEAYDQIISSNGVSGTSYQIFNRPAQSTVDASGVALVTRYRYGAFNKLQQVIDPEGSSTWYNINPVNGNRTDAFAGYGSAVQALTHYTYNARGFMTSVTDPDGRVTSYIPNAFGNLEYTIIKGVVANNEDLTPLNNTSAFAQVDPSAHWIVYWFSRNWRNRIAALSAPRW